MRGLPYDRHPQGHPVGHDIQKTAETGTCKAQPEGGDQIGGKSGVQGSGREELVGGLNRWARAARITASDGHYWP